MSETSQLEKEETGGVVHIHDRTLISPKLGLISVDGAGVLLDPEARSHNNSTRWVLDFYGACPGFRIQLLEFRSGRALHPDLLSVSLLPRSSSCYEVKPYLDKIEGGELSVVHKNPIILCTYRLCIDAMHTATR